MSSSRNARSEAGMRFFVVDAWESFALEEWLVTEDLPLLLEA